MQETIFQSVVETIREPLLVLDRELRVRIASRSFYRHFRVAEEETAGHFLRELGNGQWRIPALARLLEVVSAAGAPVEAFEVTHDFEHLGRRTMLLNARRIDEGDDHHAGWVLLAIEDVTERRRAEAERDALITELTRSNEELERFAYVASHDLQEPLRMVASYSQLLARRYEGKLDEKADRYIRYAVDGAARMQALINDLLAYSRVGRGAECRSLDAGEVLREALARLELAVRHAGASVTAGPLPRVEAEPTELLQLFQNLVSNALKFRRPHEAPRVRVTAEHRGREWVFAVADNGMGIDPGYFERVFVIFQRLHPAAAYPGTGIGLAICRKIVERHGGRIWVESAPGEGSTFYFSLPAAEEE
ncbi:MAG TPA: ATP-binding protein [Longimicrobiaceae bacterium]|nr:ATP-binding protein [Longimicrobiaceae bacterium]